MPYRVQKIEDFVQQLESGDLKLRVRVLEVLKADILFYFFDVVLSTCIQMNWVWFECWPNLKLHPFIYLWCLVVQWVVPSQNWSAPLRRLIGYLVLVPGCRYIIYILTLMLSLPPSFSKVWASSKEGNNTTNGNIVYSIRWDPPKCWGRIERSRQPTDC